MSDSRTVLITGVTRGLGRAMARGFAARGHRVDGCGRSKDDLRTLAAELGDGHCFRTVDVSSAEEVERWAREVLDAGRVPDLLINNAALFNRRAPLWEISVEELDRIVDVNVKGTVHVLRAFLPAMIDRGRGVVVNFSSGWGHTTDAEVAPYCATKFAIEGLTQALAKELPEGLVAVPLSPGIIHTEMLDVAFGDQASSFPKPEEWAETAVPYILGLGAGDNGVSRRIPAH
jgi:NAD(P)-dependent dehydrogenase (short-subunit alcohol dehydrogenase family)